MKSAATPRFLLPRQGSNLDSSDPESDVLPVTPRGSGAEGDRTPDLRIANAALSHLSYSPKNWRNPPPEAGKKPITVLQRVNPRRRRRGTELRSSCRPWRQGSPETLRGPAPEAARSLASIGPTRGSRRAGEHAPRVRLFRPLRLWSGWSRRPVGLFVAEGGLVNQEVGLL